MFDNLSEKDCWRALENRDASFDGRFFFGVVTTGVYCRPSCPSRRAKPENVRFYPSAAAAAAAGLRPCLKCQPQRQSSEAMAAVADFIDTHVDETLSLARLAREFKLSTSHLQRRFKSAYGVSPKQYQNAARLNQFRTSLRHGSDVTEAIFAAGFGSTSRIYEQVDGHLGMTPSAYRDGGKGETIAYAIRTTTLGHLLMAATDRGVCFVHFGAGEAALTAALQHEYPNATLSRSAAESAPALNQWIDALNHHLDRGSPAPAPPLHLNGTAFQMRVWRFLMSVPEGAVASYTEVARGMGAPKSARAVANACGANNIALLIPCHRVLRSDGSLGGYRWGTERKRALIDTERSRAVTATTRAANSNS
ncbi:bifunctional DNA-binding transcriptional regulator/O6-methylguanine-DNA methyltransferase Ada [Exilibacterium tricleocarpae]|uniref:methylated-DNA--[protein]-cysteine S-methyltransferase n=1 Tax=Exilibacterium tricleocarpae TaxID=2591008 RepID=A0A545SS50_9GAMM|nr:bifunctional DNA-binding transcriptional regulator/O6-methylguanine-DNA methyltransferase Ada [Exilibacterium tricleocarpae]TQV67793.1 bifunctional DNA-binding transcriptional regulator/O6-methylguanine-DNA methyltransferase Ada [Exilibacterium tricleocarpae]